ncbi:MAG: DUF3052 family protein [Acidimicrobiia bacterium]|nr:DUF3052 family protein [Acidimicrobiia bacterium]
MPAGYSKRSLLEKLGIKAGFRLSILNAPEAYDETLGELPPGARRLTKPKEGMDFIQLFVKHRSELERTFPALKKELAETGMLWISWPKATAKIDTDVNENVVREIGLSQGMVDVKVCAVDEVWSGLKFVHRLADRQRLAKRGK